MACTRMPRLLPAAARSRETRTHSSRVGTTTSACGTPSPPSAGGTTRCSIGTPKPRVLPVPVRAWPMRSLPASASGRVSSWMAKVRVIPTSASAATMSGCTSKSLNSGLSPATGAPPSSSTCDSSSSGAGAPVSACSSAVASVDVGVFSVEVSALASGLRGEQVRADAASDRSRVGVAGISSSADAASRPGVRSPGDSPSGRRPAVVSAQIHSAPGGTPIPIVARPPVSLSAPRCHGDLRHLPQPVSRIRGPQERCVTTPVDSSAVVDLLGALAYAELTAFDRLAEDARMAPTLAGRAALARMAAAEIGHHGRLTERLSELGADPSEAMAPFVPALDAFHESTRPSTWLEGLVKAYVGDGLASDFYREIAAFLPHPDRALVMEVLADTGHADFAVREVRAAIKADRKVPGRLSLWGRRLVGEAMSQSQAVIPEHDELAQLIVAGTGDFTGLGRLIERITTAHTERMKTLGLNP